MKENKKTIGYSISIFLLIIGLLLIYYGTEDFSNFNYEIRFILGIFSSISSIISFIFPEKVGYNLRNVFVYISNNNNFFNMSNNQNINGNVNVQGNNNTTINLYDTKNNNGFLNQYRAFKKRFKINLDSKEPNLYAINLNDLENFKSFIIDNGDLDSVEFDNLIKNTQEIIEFHHYLGLGTHGIWKDKMNNYINQLNAYEEKIKSLK